MRALFRLIALLLALALCVGVALFVYVALGQGPSIARLVPTGLDGPVSADPRRETFTIRAGQSAAEIGDGAATPRLDPLGARLSLRNRVARRWE